MASSGTVKVTIQAVDKATATLDKINSRIEKSMGGLRRAFSLPKVLSEATDRFAASAKRFSDTTGLTRAATAMRNLGHRAGEAARSISLAVPALGALTAAGTVAGLVRMGQAFGDISTRLLGTSRTIRMSVADIQKWRDAAEMAGISADQLDGSFVGLDRSIRDAAAGRNNSFLNLLTNLRVSLRDSNGELRTAGDVATELADKLANLNDNPRLQQSLVDALGGDIRTLLPLLRRGQAGINALFERVAANNTITQEQAEAGDRLRQSFVGVQQAVSGLVQSIGANLEPVLRPFLEWIKDTINANREWIATGFAGAVGRLVRWIQEVDWAAVGRNILSVGEAIGAVARHVSSFVESVDKFLGGDGSGGRALTAFLGLWAGSRILSIIGNIAAMATAMSGLASATSLLALAGPVGMLAAIGYWITQLQPRNREQQNENWRTGRGSVAGTNASTTNANDESNWLMDRLIADGESPENAAGITANFMHESSGRWNAVNNAGGGEGARGGFQWRADRLRAFRARYGVNPDEATREQQYEFMRAEMAGGDVGAARARRDMQGNRNPYDAGVIFGQQFERYGNRSTPEGRREAENEDNRRGQTAERLLQQYRARVPANSNLPVPGRQSSNATGNANLVVTFANAPQGMTATVTRQAGVNVQPRQVRSFDFG